MALCACNGNCLKYGTCHPEGNIGWMSDRTNDLATRIAPVRQALWDNGEITIAGLRRLDEVLGIETYAEKTGEDDERSE